MSIDMNLSKLQEIVRDRGTWRAAVHGVGKSQTWLSHWSTTSRLCKLFLEIWKYRLSKNNDLYAKTHDPWLSNLCHILSFSILAHYFTSRYLGFPGGSVVKNPPANAGKDPLEKEMATHSSILACRIPWTEEPGGLQSMGSQRTRHDQGPTLGDPMD